MAAAAPLPPDTEEGATDEPTVGSGTPWNLRPTSLNNQTLRDAFTSALRTSAQLAPQDRLIQYDACDESEISIPLALGARKRLDPRRNTKPKKPDEQLLVCTPFNPDGFHFGKIRNPGERLLTLPLANTDYHVLTNKFPLFPKHMLLVADALVPQQMTHGHLTALTGLLQATSFCAYYNSWCASASVNHFHCHLIDELPPVTARPLVPGPLVAGVRSLQPQGFPGFCYVFEAAHALLVVDELVRAMQADNQPHNLLFTPDRIYLFPKPLVRPTRSFELYPETVGGPELIGSFTVYQPGDLERLTAEDCEELYRINTAPLPSRHLHHEAPSFGLDDAAVPSATASPHQTRPQEKIRASKSLDLHVRMPRMAASASAWRGRRRDAGGGA